MTQLVAKLDYVLLINGCNGFWRTSTYQSASASGGTGGAYSKSYSYHPNTGNLHTKSTLGAYTYSTTHKHAVTSISNGWSFQ